MAEKHNRLTSWEISQYLIELGRAATAREVAEGLKLKYPQYHSSLRDVYLRLRSIALSHNSDCVVDLSVRPRTFYLTRIDDAFFRRCRNPERIPPGLREKMLMDEDEKERAGADLTRLMLYAPRQRSCTRQAVSESTHSS